MPHDATAKDSELLASWAIESLGQGRLELARALTQLAIQAERLERRVTHVPFAGHTRLEAPARPYLVAAHDGPTGNGDADIRRAEAAATAIFGAVSQPVLGVPESGRCDAKVINSGHEVLCNMPIFWAHGYTGDASTPATPAGWHHVDSTYDDDHPAYHA